tara:strand:+ start:336 stop:1283 length:948 start_codon:yes stop_codon:yes gene_type:complete
MKNNKEKILVTGCAGFIGSHLCEELLKNDYIVYGLDNMNIFYDLYKKKNLEILLEYKNFIFEKDDIRTTKIISKIKPTKICHLASIAGVRYSLENPIIYYQNNVEGFINIMEEARKNNIKNVIYASSSSVYGLNEKIPFNETDNLEKFNSPYALSKYCMELYAKLYYQLYNINSIGLRFFTVYGPRGRPDMAPYKFLNSIMNEKIIKKYGDGNSYRDYTYISDIVNGIIGAINNKNNIKCDVYNLGNSNPITLNNFIKICEKITNKKAIIEKLPNQLGDVPYTYADINKAKKDLDYEPKITFENGLKNLYEYLKK